MMKSDIILAGVGGQGILSIAATIGLAAVNNNMYLKQAEVHGMSQRGGDVQSNLRISENPIASDLIPKGKADLILSVEPMESLRYLPWLSKDGWVVTNAVPFENIPNYPDTEEVLAEIRKLPQHQIVEADHHARELGNSRVSNMIMLGAASHYIHIPFDGLLKAVEILFGKKGNEIVELNQNALKLGRELQKS